MFSIFNKKNTGPKIIDSVWMGEKAKWQACLQLIQKEKNVLFVAWFDEAKNRLTDFFKTNKEPDYQICLSNELPNLSLKNKKIIFIEHHPNHTKEKEVFELHSLKEANFYSSLDEPIFKNFAADRIISLMKKMGAAEEEVITHPSITTAITSAQEQLARHISYDQYAVSQNDWILKHASSS